MNTTKLHFVTNCITETFSPKGLYCPCLTAGELAKAAQGTHEQPFNLAPQRLQKAVTQSQKTTPIYSSRLRILAAGRCSHKFQGKSVRMVTCRKKEVSAVSPEVMQRIGLSPLIPNRQR